MQASCRCSAKRSFENDLKDHFIRRKPAAKCQGLEEETTSGARSPKAPPSSRPRRMDATVAITDPRIHPHLFGGHHPPGHLEVFSPYPIPRRPRATSRAAEAHTRPLLSCANKKGGTTFPRHPRFRGFQIDPLEVHYWLKPSVRTAKTPTPCPPRKNSTAKKPSTAPAAGWTAISSANEQPNQQTLLSTADAIAAHLADLPEPRRRHPAGWTARRISKTRSPRAWPKRGGAVLSHRAHLRTRQLNPHPASGYPPPQKQIPISEFHIKDYESAYKWSSLVSS